MDSRKIVVISLPFFVDENHNFFFELLGDAAEHDLRLIIENDLHGLVGQPENDGMFGLEPLFQMNLGRMVVILPLADAVGII